MDRHATAIEYAKEVCNHLYELMKIGYRNQTKEETIMTGVLLELHNEAHTYAEHKEKHVRTHDHEDGESRRR